MNAFKVPIIAALLGILSLLGVGFTYLDAKKADKEAIAEVHRALQQDMRELRGDIKELLSRAR